MYSSVWYPFQRTQGFCGENINAQQRNSSTLVTTQGTTVGTNVTDPVTLTTVATTIKTAPNITQISLLLSATTSVNLNSSSSTTPSPTTTVINTTITSPTTAVVLLLRIRLPAVLTLPVRALSPTPQLQAAVLTLPVRALSPTPQLQAAVLTLPVRALSPTPQLQAAVLTLPIRALSPTPQLQAAVLTLPVRALKPLLSVSLKPPMESYQHVRYESTTNHYWSFEKVLGKPFIFDRAPDSNILTKSIYERQRLYDSKLRNDVRIKSDLNNPENSLFLPLNGTLPEGRLTAPGIDKSQNSIYVNMNENESCVCLLNDITRERYYFKQCLLDVNECDYGLSLSVWLQFTTETFNPKEVIISTAPEKGKGFSLLINNGMLEFELRTTDTLWKVSSSITKTLNKWINIGVAWGKSAQSIKLVINGNTVSMKNNYQGVQHLGSNSTPTSIWVGCNMGLDGEKIISSINPGIRVATVALWYWPIQLNQLFSGGLENYLLKKDVIIESSVSQPIKTINYADYTNEVEELTPTEEISKILNPVYLMADYYNPLLFLASNYTGNDVKLVVDRSKLKTAYQLTSNGSCFEVKFFNEFTCPGSVNRCTQGLSMGIWLNIPDILNTTVVILDILELVNGITVSVYNSYINIFITTSKGLVVFRVYNVIPKDIWFNLGISVSNFIDPTVAVYFNGIAMLVEQVMPPIETPTKRNDRCLNGLILGSSKINRSAAGVAYNDLILWYRWLFSFESHLFVGYTRAQQANLHNASYYWTPDPYIAYDSNVQIQVRQKYNYLQPENDYSLTGIPGYSLASIYRSKFVTFRFSQNDYENKSKVPVFEMKPQQYMMLGLRKSSEVISTNLIWTGKCLIEPSLSTCNTRGFSISIWLKILSVSSDRLRFYLSSGDGGTSLSSMSYYRGISIFTDTSLIGVSISQFSLTWQLVLDSSSYKIGKWINIGILWRGDVGLTLLLDGVNYGSTPSSGQKVYKTRESPPYLVLGRYDTDNQATWLSPSDADDATKQSNGSQPQWEMSHYALGDIAYFDKLLTHKEYNQQIGLLNVPYLRNSDGNVWFGKGLISPPLSQIMEAVSRRISKPGPILNGEVSDSVLLLSNPEAVQLTAGGSLRLGTFELNSCPFNLQNCQKGLSIGGWYRFGGHFLKPTDSQMEPIILFTGYGGNYGLAVSYNGVLFGGWLQYDVKQGNKIVQNYWKCIANNLQIGLNQKSMQWVHFSLIWGVRKMNNSNENVLQLSINGLVIAECRKNSQPSNQQWIDKAIQKSTQLFDETNTDKESFLLVSSQTSDPTQRIKFSIALLALQPRYLTQTNFMNLIGVEYFELLELLYSTFHWQMSGLFYQLTSNRIQTVNSYYGRDQYDTSKGAICTEGNNFSYIILNGDKISTNGDMTNLYESCLYDPSKCSRYALSFRFILLKIPSKINGPQEILRTAPINPGVKYVGLLMYLSSDQSKFIIEVRNLHRTSRNSVKLDSIQQPGKWINMQIFYYQDRASTIHVDGNLILSTENVSSIPDSNSRLKDSERLKQNLIVGRGLEMCISSMTLYDISSESDFDLLANTASPQTCYTNMDIFEALPGPIDDYKNRTNSASRLENFVEPLSFLSKSCIQNPDICSKKGMTMSMWIMINGFVNESGEQLILNNNESVNAIILSTGPPDNSGILIQVNGRLENSRLKLSLKTSVFTQNYLWLVDSNNALELGQWTNIGFSWFSQPEDNSGSLEIYINGLRKQSSTIPASAINMNTNLNGTSQIFIGSAYYNVNKYTTNSDMKIFATGGIANLAYWESKNVISCSKPRKTKKFLLGDCGSNTDIPETVTCVMMQGCRQVDGFVCMDQTLPNLIRMTNQANKIIYPSDFMKVLQISMELLKNHNSYQSIVNNSSIGNTDNNNDASYGLNVLSSTLSIIRLWSRTIELLTDTTDQSIINEIISVKQNVHSLITDLTHQLLSSEFKETWSQLLQDQNRKYNELLPGLNRIILSMSKVNAYNQLDSCNTLMKLRNVDVASYLLNFQLNNTSNNLLIVNVSHLTNPGDEIHRSQFNIKTYPNNYRQNATLGGVLAILAISGNENGELMIADIPLDKFSITTQHQQNYIDTKQNSYNNTTLQPEIQYVFLIASPLYAIEFYTENQSNTTSSKTADNNTTIQLNYTVPLLRPNKYQSVYFYETTWRMKWMAYNAEKYHEKDLANEIRCVYWDDQSDTNGAWNTDGCQIVESTKTHVQCSCNHLSLFAVAMESEDAPYRSMPIWRIWGIRTESECTMLMNIIIFGGNGLSLICSLIFLVTLIIVWKKASIPDVCLTRIGLCLCQIGFHVSLLIEPLMNKYQIPCQAIGVSLNLFAILVSSWLLNEAVSLFKSFVLGQLKLTYCWTWITGIIIPVLLVLIPAVVSKLNSHGGDLLCLPAHESLEFWIMFGSMFAYTIINIIVCFTLTCNIETPAFLPSKILDRLLTRVKNLNSLLLYYIINWSLLFVVIQIPIPYVVFIALALVSLQGTWSFIVYGLEDRELFKACSHKTEKQEQDENIVETNKLPINTLIMNTEKDELNITNKSNHRQGEDNGNDTQVSQRNKNNKDIE
ncbi:unnamed protein product [Schistosoma turkestanicum]|nr:unnamed protein product [Schistosoma turkestanicum]